MAAGTSEQHGDASRQGGVVESRHLKGGAAQLAGLRRVRDQAAWASVRTWGGGGGGRMSRAVTTTHGNEEEVRAQGSVCAASVWFTCSERRNGCPGAPQGSAARRELSIFAAWVQLLPAAPACFLPRSFSERQVSFFLRLDASSSSCCRCRVLRPAEAGLESEALFETSRVSHMMGLTTFARACSRALLMELKTASLASLQVNRSPSRRKQHPGGVSTRKPSPTSSANC